MGKISYKIDRIISNNNTLTLGLKNSASLQVTENNLTSNKPLFYDSSAINEFNSIIKSEHIADNTNSLHYLVTKGYTDSAILKIRDALIIDLLSQNRILPDEDGRISITRKNSSARDANITIGMNPFYTASDTAIGGTFNNDAKTMHITSDDTKQVIGGLKLDQYGKIIGVDYKTIKTSDLNNEETTFDNYVKWIIKVGAAQADVTSQKIVNFAASSDGGLAYSLNSTAGDITLTASLLTDSESFEFINKEKQLSLKNIHDADKSIGFYKIAIDKKGRVTNYTDVTVSDITGLTPVHSSGVNGLVNAKLTNTEVSVAAGSDNATKFYTSNAKWATIPFDKVKTEDLTSSTGLPLLVASSSTDSSITTYRSSKIIANNSGKITATAFAGDGSELTKLNATNITSGQVAYSVLPKDIKDVVDTGISKVESPNNNVVYLTSGHKVATPAINSVASADNQKLNLVLTRDAAYNPKDQSNNILSAPKWVDIQGLVKNIVAGDGGMRFMGTIGNSDATFTKLPEKFQKGDFYKITTVMEPANVANFNVEPGDSIYAIEDSPSREEYIKNPKKYWSVIQSNIDKPLIFDASAINKGFLLIKNSANMNVAHSVDAEYKGNAWTLTTNITGNSETSTKWKAPINIWGNELDGSKSIGTIEAIANIQHVGHIETDANNTYHIGASGKAFADIWATNLHGSLAGNATSADKVNHAFTIQTDEADPITFDGSSAEGINLSTTNGLLKDFLTGFSFAKLSAETKAISDAQKIGYDYFVSSFSAPEIKDHAVSTAPSFTKALTKINTDIFSYSTTENKLSYKVDPDTTNSFFTNTSGKFPTRTEIIGFNGQILAKDLLIVDRINTNRVTSVHVAQNKTTSLSSGLNQSILVKQTDASGEYGFVDSSVQITNEIKAGDKFVPTTGAVKAYVDNQTATAIDGALKVIAIEVKTKDINSTTKLKANSVIDHIDIAVESAFTKNSGFNIKMNNQVLISSTEMDLKTSDEVFSYKLSKRVTQEDFIHITDISVGETSPSAFVYVYYSIPVGLNR